MIPLYRQSRRGFFRTTGPAWTACLLFLSLAARADDWPQWLGPNRDGVWREDGIVERFPAGGPPRIWRQPVGGGYSGPAIFRGRVLVMDRQLAENAHKPGDAFDRTTIPGNERVLCLDARDGSVLWKHVYDCPYAISYSAGPRATPAIDGERVYTLGAEGHLLCLNLADGRLIWSRDFKKEFGAKTPLWGFASNPLVDGNKVICLVGGKGAVAMAFDKTSGKELWRALDAKEPGYAPPMIFTAQGKRQLIIWHPEALNALDPETGKVFWSRPAPVQSALTIPTPRLDGDRLFVSSFYNGSVMLRLTQDGGPALLWQSGKVSEKDTDGLHCIIGTPFILEDHIYGVCSYGQLRCLDASTGNRLWETLAATTHDGKPVRWGTAFLTRHRDRFFLFNELGELIIARLSPRGYEEVDRAKLIAPDNPDPGRMVVWSQPAFAGRQIYVRNDHEIACFSLARGN